MRRASRAKHVGIVGGAENKQHRGSTQKRVGVRGPGSQGTLLLAGLLGQAQPSKLKVNLTAWCGILTYRALRTFVDRIISIRPASGDSQFPTPISLAAASLGSNEPTS